MVSILALAVALQSAPSSAPPPPPMLRRPPPPILVAPPAPPPPPPAGWIAPPRPRSSLATYVAADDYPAEAMRNEEEGLVVFRLHVGVDGRVIGCTVTRSSGSASLDETTCAIMQRRARFAPAMERGRPAIGAVEARVRWQLASDPPEERREGQDAAPVIVQRTRPVTPLAALVRHEDFPAAMRGASNIGTSRFRLDVGPDGRVTACEIILTSQSPELDAAACRLMRARARFTPARDSAGNPAADAHWGHLIWRSYSTPPVPAPPILPQRQ